MIDLVKLDQQLRDAGVPVATVRDNGRGRGLEVVLRDGAKREDFSEVITEALLSPPRLGPAERLRESGVDPERAALALVLSRADKAPEWARDLVESLAEKAEDLLA